ncbi:MAG: TetR/AcrR family transcriptional regulator [Microthrixaceae bacterium]
MPRISAGTVAEHVAAQESAILAAAARLFVERGYAATTLADIADEVGLKRNSLYRYFPDKEEILLRWFRVELAPLGARSAELLTADRPPLERIAAWVDLQLDYVADPAHELGAQLMAEPVALSGAARAELADGHRRLGDLLARAVAEATGRRRTAELDAALVMAMVNEVARRAAGARTTRAERRRLHDAVRAVLEPAPR